MSEYNIKLNRKANGITLHKIERKISLIKRDNIILFKKIERHISLIKKNHVIKIEHVGRKGEKGDTGNDNLFIQDTQPVTTLDKYVWFETSGGNLKTLWVETGI